MQKLHQIPKVDVGAPAKKNLDTFLIFDLGNFVNNATGINLLGRYAGLSKRFCFDYYLEYISEIVYDNFPAFHD